MARAGAAAALAALQLLARAGALRLPRAEAPDPDNPQELNQSQELNLWQAEYSEGAASQGNHTHWTPAAMPPPRPLAWLHIPKCGTSFGNVLYQHKDICPWFGPRAYMKVGVQWSDFKKKGSLEKHCPGSFVPGFSGDHGGLGLAYWLINGSRIVAFFRQPEQRLISGYLDKRKDYPDKKAQDLDILKYAQKLQGCAARMLTRGGMPCGSNFHEVSQNDVNVAVQRVKELAFVGLTDQWDFSVCMFYRMFGGNCTDVAFLNMRPGKSRNNTNKFWNKRSGLYDVQHYLGNFRDRWDGPVYEAAKEVFWGRMKEYEITRSNCARICAGATQTNPFAIRDRRGQVSLSRFSESRASSFEFDWPGRLIYEED